VIHLNSSFSHTVLGDTGLKVHRLGLSCTYRPGKKTIFKALDHGLNYFFFYGFDGQLIKTLRDVLPNEREKYVLSTGAYNLFFTHTSIRKTLEKRLRQLKTEYIDVFMLLGVTKPKHFPESAFEELYKLKDEGKIKAVGMSCHDRKFAGKMAQDSKLDVLMIRYNAAHRGAEKDIFPYLKNHNPGVVGYTATRWGYLIRRNKKWPKERKIPTAEQCYRFVLSNPDIHVCLTAPSNMKHFEENIAALEKGPLSDDEIKFMVEYGDVVHHTKKWFM